MAVTKLCILGSTGSIGTQAISLVEELGITVTALSAQRNAKLLAEQARMVRPQRVCMVDESAAKELKVLLADTDIRVLAGAQGLAELAATADCDTVLNSVVGMAGLVPTLAAIDAGRDIALANKETLVAGGQLITQKVKEKGVKLLPVDSEHSAIFQCLQDVHAAKRLRRILLTASGGPFYGRTREQLRDVTIADALNHPNWSMGQKITVDSATLMNKALELIEAMWLFNLPPDDIVITVHRQSILHSGVEFDDGALLAQLGVPDMRLPIQYALTYPDRLPCAAEPLTIEKMANLTFARPDTETFTCLAAGIKAAKQGGLAPAMANAANEVAVELFLKGEIGFLDIGDIVMHAVENAPQQQNYTLQQVLDTDKQAREDARRFANTLSKGR
ncbi:MAG: 1-deoxy-D-xylulose-5-phosphate reductoisomerase [Oscillospiraceae bacterium]|nr:1-deoxy-D-xylulose-5-phosphate reductoisomerase [Oscillospiraceae bacterium]